MLELDRQDPSWGAGCIRVELKRMTFQAELPSVRTIQRWLRRHDLARAPPGRPQGRSWQRAEHPHDTWDVDAADQKRLADGQLICWLRVVGELLGGSVEQPCLPPRATSPKCTPRMVQAELRCCFRRWGRPVSLRLDNGYPRGSCGESPTTFAWWLVGMDIGVNWKTS